MTKRNILIIAISALISCIAGLYLIAYTTEIPLLALDCTKYHLGCFKPFLTFSNLAGWYHPYAVGGYLVIFVTFYALIALFLKSRR